MLNKVKGGWGFSGFADLGCEAGAPGYAPSSWAPGPAAGAGTESRRTAAPPRRGSKDEAAGRSREVPPGVSSWGPSFKAGEKAACPRLERRKRSRRLPPLLPAPGATSNLNSARAQRGPAARPRSASPDWVPALRTPHPLSQGVLCGVPLRSARGRRGTVSLKVSSQAESAHPPGPAGQQPDPRARVPQPGEPNAAA